MINNSIVIDPKKDIDKIRAYVKTKEHEANIVMRMKILKEGEINHVDEFLAWIKNDNFSETAKMFGCNRQLIFRYAKSEKWKARKQKYVDMLEEVHAMDSRDLEELNHAFNLEQISRALDNTKDSVFALSEINHLAVSKMYERAIGELHDSGRLSPETETEIRRMMTILAEQSRILQTITPLTSNNFSNENRVYTMKKVIKSVEIVSESFDSKSKRDRIEPVKKIGRNDMRS